MVASCRSPSCRRSELKLVKAGSRRCFVTRWIRRKHDGGTFCIVWKSTCKHMAVYCPTQEMHSIHRRRWIVPQVGMEPCEKFTSHFQFSNPCLLPLARVYYSSMSLDWTFDAITSDMHDGILTFASQATACALLPESNAPQLELQLPRALELKLKLSYTSSLQSAMIISHHYLAR